MTNQHFSNFVTLLAPVVSTPEAVGEQIAPRLRELKGIRLGLLDNSKPMAHVILETLAAEMEREFSIAVEWFVKPYASRMHAPEELQEFARHCDAVVTALGD